MMKRIIDKFVIGSIITAFVISVSCNSKEKAQNQATTELSLDKKLEVFVTDSLIQTNKDSLVINFSQQTNFEWDSLFIFEPYTSDKLIEEELGFKWSSAKSEIRSLGETKTLLVFLKADEIVKTFKYPRNKGDFIKLDMRGPYKRQEGIFTIKKEKYGEEDWLFFYFTPPSDAKI
ncbi:hypothetical protein [Gracilimonas sediminicola]|uniref:hypothetical protein n=1 Tax=Gracilimonas sediminicola TaxID=2952158 RepID=UPI0038D4DDAE